MTTKFHSYIIHLPILAYKPIPLNYIKDTYIRHHVLSATKPHDI